MKKYAIRAKDSVIREQIAPLRANQIAGITSDFKIDYRFQDRLQIIIIIFFKYIIASLVIVVIVSGIFF